MAKTTSRDNWRVVATFNPMQTHVSAASFGFTDRYGDPVEGNLWGSAFELTVYPRRLGDFGFISMGDRMASRDIDGDYRKACESIKVGMLRHPNVTAARIEVDEEEHCSFCGGRWEVLSAEDALDRHCRLDEHSIAGEPVCCHKAVAEFRTEHSIPPEKTST